MKTSQFWIAIGVLLGFAGVYSATVNGDAWWIAVVGLVGFVVCSVVGLIHGVKQYRRAG